MKKRKKMLGKVVLVVGMAVFLVCASAGRPEAERKNYNLYMSLEGVSSSGGMGTAEWREISVLGVRILSEKTGFNLHPMFMPTLKDVFKNIKKGKVDFANLSASSYVRLRANGVALKPVIGFYTGSADRLCVYVNKNQNIKTMRDLKGKKLALSKSYLKRLKNFPSTDPYERYFHELLMSDFLFVRQWLDRAGIGTLLDSGIRFSIDYPNTDSKLIALDKGMIDAVLADSKSVYMYDRGGMPFRNIQEITCTEEVFSSVLAATDRVPQSVIEIIQQAVEGETEHPGAEFREILKRSHLEIGKAGMVIADDDDFQIYYDLWREAEDKGWVEEVNEVVTGLIEEANEKK